MRGEHWGKLKTLSAAVVGLLVSPLIGAARSLDWLFQKFPWLTHVPLFLLVAVVALFAWLRPDKDPSLPKIAGLAVAAAVCFSTWFVVRRLDTFMNGIPAVQLAQAINLAPSSNSYLASDNFKKSRTCSIETASETICL